MHTYYFFCLFHHSFLRLFHYVSFSLNKAQEEHEIYSQRIKDSLSGSSPSIKSGTSPATSNNNTTQSQLRHSIEAAIHHVDHTWKLNTDTALSDLVRAEFYYEQVCLSWTGRKLQNVSLHFSLLLPGVD